MWVWSLGWVDPPGGGNGDPLCILAWKIPLTESLAAVQEVAKSWHNWTPITERRLALRLNHQSGHLPTCFYVFSVVLIAIGNRMRDGPKGSWIVRVCNDLKKLGRLYYYLHFVFCVTRLFCMQWVLNQCLLPEWMNGDSWLGNRTMFKILYILE